MGYIDTQAYMELGSGLAVKYKQRSLNLRAVFAEFVGMLFFVFVGCGTAISFSSQRYVPFAEGATADLVTLEGHLQNAITINGSFGINTALAFGIGITVLAYCLGHISGGHFNPAVTFSLVLSGNCNVVQGAANVVAQFAGSIVAACILYGITPRSPASALGANIISESYSVGGALGGEVVCTALLCFTVLLTACTKSNDVKPMAPLAIGFSVFLAHTVMIPIDGCSINPARSFGPALIAGEWANFWVFVAGPLLGGVVGTLLWAGVAVRWDKRDLFSGDAVLGQAASPAAKDALV